jgi:hypothetical protein
LKTNHLATLELAQKAEQRIGRKKKVIYFRFLDASENSASACFFSNFRLAADTPPAPAVSFRFWIRPWPVTFFKALGTM